MLNTTQSCIKWPRGEMEASRPTKNNISYWSTLRRAREATDGNERPRARDQQQRLTLDFLTARIVAIETNIEKMQAAMIEVTFVLLLIISGSGSSTPYQSLSKCLAVKRKLNGTSATPAALTTNGVAKS